MKVAKAASYYRCSYMFYGGEQRWGVVLGDDARPPMQSLEPLYEVNLKLTLAPCFLASSPARATIASIHASDGWCIRLFIATER